MRSFVTGGSGFVGRELIRALAARGHEVRALARSAKSREAVRSAGAEPVQGDLDDSAGLAAGMQGAELVFHAAAHTEEWDTHEAFHRVNVIGTENVLAAARAAKVRRLVHVSTEAVLANGKPIVQVDESVPTPADVLPGYPASKALAEERVQSANDHELQTVIIRPRLIWGRGDTSLLVKLVAALESGRLMWIARGRYPTSTCHVANVCEGAILAAERGHPGAAYFLTDGAPVEFRWFLSELIQTQRLEPPDKSVPRWLARATAASSERIWKSLRLRGTPLATRTALGLMGHEVTVRDAKARRELGYTAAVSIADGLAELARLPPLRAAP